VVLWDLETQAVKQQIKYQSSQLKQLSSKWDPINSNLVAVALGNNFRVMDLREDNSKIAQGQVTQMHSNSDILDLDYNTLKLHTLSTVGMD